MTKNPLPPAPEGYEYIFRPWKTCPHTKKILWAKNYGLKAWPILVPISGKETIH